MYVDSAEDIKEALESFVEALQRYTNANAESIDKSWAFFHAATFRARVTDEDIEWAKVELTKNGN